MSPAANIVHINWLVVANVKRALPQGPHTLPLSNYIAIMQAASSANPNSAELHACLGIAFALNHETKKGVHHLVRATQLKPHHFFARFKLASLLHCFSDLPQAESESLKALALACTQSEISLARQQLAAIRDSMQSHPTPLRFSLRWT